MWEVAVKSIEAKIRGGGLLWIFLRTDLLETSVSRALCN